MNNPILDTLNDAQRDAVSSPANHLLVLAGAGSGKTRVLVHRIAWLIEQQHFSPLEIMAVTFTNKAAAEMRGRIEQMLNTPMQKMWVGTFHGLAHRLLRIHWQDANLPDSFQILDGEDQLRLIKRIHRSLNLDDERWPPRQSQWFINGQKDKGVRYDKVAHDGQLYTDTLISVYQAYEQTCQRSGLVDFAELLLRSYDVLRNHPDVLTHYQQRFRHILVDEFQDTNAIQYDFIQLLAGKNSQVTIVGDDDQSIYSWRGAQVENLNRFGRDYPDTQTIRLEQNYRSTQTILSAANKIIANNSNRMGKNLWTDGNKGEQISVYSAFNEVDEARFIVSRIQDWITQGNNRSECALLYRANAQSRVLEEALIEANIPYRVYGGLRFFERMEIKDALSYLRLIENRNDDSAFERVINKPTRGIGNTSLMAVRDCAREQSLSLWQACQHIVEHKSLSGRATNALQTFIDLIDALEKDTQAKPLHEQTDHVLRASGLLEHYRNDTTEKGISRVENLEELLNATREFAFEHFEGMTPLAAFLSNAALEAGDSQGEQFEDCVQLMTLHSAKGLEFPLVFLTGLEEGQFPHVRSLNELASLEEERRLCYVGMTRAKQKLYLTYAESRRLHGKENFRRPSRFLQELPKELIDEVRVTTQITRPTSFSSSRQFSSRFNSNINESGYKLGQRVKHPKFGEGTVINFEGSSQSGRIQIEFDEAGSKWLVASFAKLEVV